MKDLKTIVTNTAIGERDGCPGTPLRAVSLVLRIFERYPDVILMPSAPPNTFTAKVAQLRTSPLCHRHPSGLLQCDNPDPTDGAFYLDAAGPVDQFDNPPAVMVMKPAVALAMPYTHPSGLFAMATVDPRVLVDRKLVRGIRVFMEQGLGFYLGTSWKPRVTDPGAMPIQDLDRIETGILSYRVNAEDWARSNVLTMRSCPEAKEAELQVGPMRFTVPAGQLLAFQATATTAHAAAGLKMVEGIASCPGHPMHVGAFRMKVDGRYVEVNGRGRNVPPDLVTTMGQIAKAGPCHDTPEGLRECGAHTADGDHTAYQVEDPALPATVLCFYPAGQPKACLLAAEVDGGFSYHVELPEKPGADFDWAAEVKRMPGLIQALRPIEARLPGEKDLGPPSR